MSHSLLEPTDNSLAQATWLVANKGAVSLDIPDDDYLIARSYEANAYRAFLALDWDSSLVSSLKWMKDQPFSSRAARSAGYLANTIFRDHELGEQIAKIGQIANPTEPAFHIALAYCYARRDRPDEASAELRKIILKDAEDWVPTAVDANQGLISYRNGDSPGGRWHYSHAVLKAGSLEDKRVKVSVLINWALEEMRYSQSAAGKLLDEAIDAGKKASGTEIPFLIDRAIDEFRSFVDRATDDAPSTRGIGTAPQKI